MKNHFLKFIKVFSNFVCSPLILIANNAELSAKYLPASVNESFKTTNNANLRNNLFRGLETKQENNF